MKGFFILAILFSLNAYPEKNIRVSFLNQKIENSPIKQTTGPVSLTLDNESFKNFLLTIEKNSKIIEQVHLRQNSTKTLDLKLTATDSLVIIPYNPPLGRILLTK